MSRENYTIIRNARARAGSSDCLVSGSSGVVGGVRVSVLL
jgi:hypothetical protein